MRPADQLRALLIALHLVIITVAAIPSPEGKLTERNFREPDIQASFSAWAGIARSVGIDVDDETFALAIWDLAKQMVGVRQAVLAPVRPWLRFSGQGQSWRMYGNVPDRAAFLEIHVGRGHGWEPLYIEHGEASWAAGLLEQGRVRAVREEWGSRRRKAQYEAFVGWIAARAKQDFPEARAVRVRYIGARIPSPAEVRALGGLPRTGPYWATTVPFEAP